MRLRWFAALALVPALISGPASAAEPDALAQRGAAIVGGTASEPCEWPSVVALQTGGLCTATLVHPRIIAYAAHCGTLHSHALFGETVDAPARSVPILHCERNSELFAVSSMDYAYCELAEPVTDVALTPLLFGCDEALIEVGTPVTIVGFGDSSPEGEPAQVGVKRAAQTQIVGMLSTIGIGGMGTGADSGDSGGPALVQLDDGSWRVLGIVSGGGGDGKVVQYVPAPLTVAWIEDRSGVDITPCHASDGSWAPTPGCAGMFVGVDADASWAEGCSGPVSGPSARCGPAWQDIVDDEPPTIAFVEPAPADAIVLGSAPVELDVLAEASDAGVGVAEVRLSVDGVAWVDAIGRAGVDEVPPYRFADVRLTSDGVHTLTLEAADHYGNTASASVELLVGEDTSEDTGESGDETGPMIDGDDGGGEPGCACNHAPARPPALLLLLLLVRPGSGRRRQLAQ